MTGRRCCLLLLPSCKQVTSLSLCRLSLSSGPFHGIIALFAWGSWTNSMPQLRLELRMSIVGRQYGKLPTTASKPSGNMFQQVLSLVVSSRNRMLSSSRCGLQRPAGLTTSPPSMPFVPSSPSKSM
ncbi:hypothetical protein BJ508DRAFT_117490 [Ascobolus immersus RN42]|uniref:Uncharacterized protein n=1 Tax=Ascobolus immersus RN42 TaxID=1160509 RepID=A0A3N4I681_ASCIM|nr:hypothetical protein BJ508DRAFT_117490 [Ascobolus immersus RN42]